MANYRQGDVFLFAVDSIPAAAKPRRSRVVALGEAIGHAHTLSGGEVYVGEDGQLFFVAGKRAALKHVTRQGTIADHKPVKVAEGKYRVVVQREYEPSGWRQVRD